MADRTSSNALALVFGAMAWTVPASAAPPATSSGKLSTKPAQGTAPGAEADDAKASDDSSMEKMDDPVGNWPRISFQTIANLEAAGMHASDGPGRRFQPYLRFDSTLLVDVSDRLSFDGLFQFKARQPRPATDPNRDLFINQGAGRRVGGKFKELFTRYETWRVGKFVQNFGRAYVLAPGPFAADFVEEPDEGYEPSEMLGVEKIHVFDGDKFGWQQLTVSAFMVDRTFLHRSFPYDEGRIRYRDGGIGNTRYPENIMVTYDVLNAPLGKGAQFSFQASAIRWGKTFGAERREFWTTAGADVTIPLTGSVADTLGGHYSHLHLYAEAAHRAHFKGVAGARRSYLTGSAEVLYARWQFDLTTTRRWTTDPVLPLRKDRLYTATLGFNFPSQSLLLLSVADERVGARHGVYAGLRLQQTLTSCSRCFTRGRAY